MAKFCPVRKRKVLYLDCLECEEQNCVSQQNNTELKESNKLLRTYHKELGLGDIKND